MGKQVQIKPDYTAVLLPDGRPHDGGALVDLTDTEYAALESATLQALTLVGNVADPVRSTPVVFDLSGVNAALSEDDAEDNAKFLSKTDAISAYLPQSPIDSFFAKLDLRSADSLVIAQASDSTGDAANEFFELSLKDSLATLWPERPATVRRWWNGPPAAYSAPETWQNGTTPTAVGPIFSDDFAIDKSVLLGSVPVLGAAYTEGGAGQAAYFNTTGGKLTRVGAAGSWALFGNTIPRILGTDISATATMSSPRVAAQTSEFFLTATNFTTCRFYIAFPSTGLVTFSKYVSAAVTVLGTFPTTYTASTPIAVGLSLVGSVMTATLGAETLTYTLTAPELAYFTTVSAVAFRTHCVGTTWDNVTVTSLRSVGTTPPAVTVYNGGSAGNTAEYQRANLAVMYPVRPDLLVVNHGHNYTVGVTISDYLVSLQGLVDDLAALYPGAPIPVVVTSQNPRFGVSANTYHVQRMMALRDYAITKGWGYIPTYEAFAVRPDGGADQMLDDVHPGVGTGRFLQRDAAKTWIRARSKRP